MGCAGCSTGKGKPGGCQSNGGCATGGCNRLNTYDWLSDIDLPQTDTFSIVEVSFKNGCRKAFYKNHSYTRAITGDMIVVETSNGGFDMGQISLSGELVRLQMRKKKVAEENILLNVVRRANERDLMRLDEVRSMEPSTMVRARVIARQLDLDMKIGDVEYQADRRKVTFYYTADGRVDFRELIKIYAREFRSKIEMRQIGARQESARIGGIGSCGRELCCSTWLTDFKSVSTAAARYQNLAINQSKLSGQCGRLKCCLNYELDTYLDALIDFPDNADILKTEAGVATLIKTDIFKGVLYYSYKSSSGSGNKNYALTVARVKEILALNAQDQTPVELRDKYNMLTPMGEEPEIDFTDVTGEIELAPLKERRKKRRRRGGRNNKETAKSKPNNRSDKKGSSKDNKEKPKTAKKEATTKDRRKSPKQEASNEKSARSTAKKSRARRGRRNPNRNAKPNNNNSKDTKE